MVPSAAYTVDSAQTIDQIYNHDSLVVAHGWVNPKGEPMVSFTMLTTNADTHPVMRPFHRPADEKRTPVVISKENYDAWRSSDTIEAATFLSLGQMPELVSESDKKRG